MCIYIYIYIIHRYARPACGGRRRRGCPLFFVARFEGLQLYTMCVYICVCIYIYIYIYTPMCIYIHIYIYIYMCTYIYIYTATAMATSTSICLSFCLSLSLSIYIYIYNARPRVTNGGVPTQTNFLSVVSGIYGGNYPPHKYDTRTRLSFVIAIMLMMISIMMVMIILMILLILLIQLILILLILLILVLVITIRIVPRGAGEPLPQLFVRCMYCCCQFLYMLCIRCLLLL